MTTPTVTIYQTTTQANTEEHCWANDWAAEGIESVDHDEPTKLRLPCDENNKCTVIIVNLGTELAVHELGASAPTSLFSPQSRTVAVDLTNSVTLSLWASQGARNPYAKLTLHK